MVRREALGAATLAVVGAGGAAFLVRRHSRYGRAAFRRSLDEPPAFAPVEGLDDDADLQDAEHERVFAHHLHGADAEPVALGTAAALRYLAAHDVGPAAVVTALQGRTDTGLTLHLVVRTALEQQARIVALAAGLGECLGGPDVARLHRAAGTGVDYAEGARARDPKRLAIYFLKESLGGAGKSL